MYQDVLELFYFVVGSGGGVGPDAVQLWVIFNDMLMVSYWLRELSSFRLVWDHNWEGSSGTWCPRDSVGKSVMGVEEGFGDVASDDF